MKKDKILKIINNILDNIKTSYTIAFLNALFFIKLEIETQGYAIFFQEDIKKVLEKKGVKVEKYDCIHYIVKTK